MRLRPLLTATALAALHLLLAALLFDPTPHGGGDNAAYLALARSLLDTGRYLELWDPATPSHTLYPPGFPALLAGGMALGLDGWATLKWLVVAFSTMAVALSYLWARSRTDPRLALGVGVLLALAPGVLVESHRLLSDVPFWAVTMAALLAFERGRPRLGIVLALLALTVRTAAIPLLAAIVLAFAFRRRWRPALALVLAVGTAAVLWRLRAGSLETPLLSSFWLVSPYRPGLGRVGALDLVARAAANGEDYAFTILFGTLTGTVGIAAVAAGLLLAFAGIGLAGRLRRGEGGGRSGAWRPGVAELFTLLYAGMLLAWPASWAAGRYLLPLLPLLLLYAAEGVGILPGRLTPPTVRLAGVVFMLALSAPRLVELGEAGGRCREAVAEGGPTACMGPHLRSFVDLAVESRDVLPTDAVVISRKPRLWYWFGERPGRIYPFATDPDSLFEEADAAGAEYVVMDSLDTVSRVYLAPVLRRHGERFCRVLGGDGAPDEPGSATLLRIVSGEEGSDRSPGSPEGDLEGGEAGGSGAPDATARHAPCPPD